MDVSPSEPTGARRPSPILRDIANILTLSRVVLAVALVVLATTGGRSTLVIAVAAIMLGWTTDSVDGHIARWGGFAERTAIGRSDVLIDTFFSLGGLAYFIVAGFLPLWAGLGYLALASFVFALAPRRATAVTLEAPVAVLPAVVSLVYQPLLGAAMVVWALFMLALDFRRFRWRLARYTRGISQLLHRQG
jgi:phosphatidylglycerophosphate synthase